jgi:nucleoside-diphosphate-sugar epimerase
MSTILVTGASGYIGKALVASLKDKHDVIAMSRKDPEVCGVKFIKGDFACDEDLKKLDDFNVDTLIHLAAVTGGCSEKEGILVNVEGTRCLMRYLIDKKCKKFIMTSSIAAVGFQNEKFRPLTLPIPDEHPCLDRDGYGLSKYLMEEITKYYQRQNEDIDVINLRLAVVPANPNDLADSAPSGEWALGSITIMLLEDAVKLFSIAAESDYKPGVRILNAGARRAWVTVPMAEILKTMYGDDFDVSFFERPENKYASVFDVSRIEKELGFVAEKTLKLNSSHFLT